MKKVLFLFLLCLSYTAVFSANEWRHQVYSSSFSTLNNVIFLTEKIGFAVGSEGAIFKTTDGGKMWVDKNKTSVKKTFNAITFFSLNKGIAVGDSGAVLITNDGGETWEINKLGQSNLNNAHFKFIKKIDQDNCTITAHEHIPATEPNTYYIRALYYKTDDAGATWTKMTYDTVKIQIEDKIYSFTYVNKGFHFLTADIGFAYGKLLTSVTTDGGSNWAVFDVHTQDYNDMAYSGEEFWMVGDTGRILHTAKLDEEWTLQNCPVNSDLLKVRFINKDTGFIVTKNQELLRTFDGGENWTVCLNASQGYYPSGLFVYSLNTLFAVGASGAIVKSTDMGDTWFNPTNSTTGRFLSVNFIDSWAGWASNDIGEIYRTTNSGEVWNKTQINNDAALLDVKFLNNLNGWAVGNIWSDNYVGALFKSTDGGANWESALTSLDTSYNSFAIANANSMYIAGDYGMILKSINGGNEWIKQNSKTTKNLFSIYFVNNNLGFAAGADGKMVKTENGGDDWQNVNTGTNKDIYGVFFRNANFGWAVGANGLLLKTENGGDNWTSRTIGGDVDLKSIRFTDDNNGYLCGKDGTLYKTENAGDNWTKISLVKEDLNALSFINANFGWVAGGNGTMLHYYDPSVVLSVNEEDLINENSIIAGPNPAIDYINVNFKNESKSNYSIGIYNVLGDNLISLNGYDSENGLSNQTLNVSNLSSGTYILVIEINGKKFSKNISIIR